MNINASISIEPEICVNNMYDAMYAPYIGVGIAVHELIGVGMQFFNQEE